ncbi:GntR family transcriptional regulator [Acuticoccus sp.]|uniref:GntR family transcriptional regulator n=1 Tax=Acuticoccus sp. TaxID=1904378 RepID=UPI003B51B1DE
MTRKGDRGGARRAADRVYELVREDIVAGLHPPGGRLGEETLADRHAVSRTPVRAALAQLASEGFVVMVPHAGAVVAQRSPREVRDIFEVRALLEGEAAGLAALRRSKDEADALGGIAGAMEAEFAVGFDVSRLSKLNQDFHARILDAAGNPTLKRSSELLMALGFLVHTYANFDGDDVRRSLNDHRNLTAAIASRDAEWARAVMRSHILGASNVLRSRIQQEPCP